MGEGICAGGEEGFENAAVAAVFRGCAGGRDTAFEDCYSEGELGHFGGNWLGALNL